MQYQELIQIGINNILVARAHGMELTKEENLLLLQWCRATNADQRLRELQINAEITNYDEAGKYIGKDTSEDIDDESDRGDAQSS